MDSISEATSKEQLEEAIATTSKENAEQRAEEPSTKRVKLNTRRIMNLAVAGCSHGEMDKIYDTLSQIEHQRGVKFDLLISCGDFQAIRNYGDLQHLKVPDKFRDLMTFYKYYSGEKVAPILTLFVGGNHESSGYMSELPNGGWVAPNIYYLGYASVVQFGGLRIAGLSGIYKGNDYDKGHFECAPFTNYSLVSAYHVRSVDVFRLKQLKKQDSEKASAANKVNVVVTHDWPAGITDFGDKDYLLRCKPFFQDDIERNQLGNPATMNLLYDLRPNRWFSAHLHVKFTAEVEHSASKCGDPAEKTKFLALDKPLPRRQFLECLEVPMQEKAVLELSYDPTWLAILKNTDHLTILSDKKSYMPGRNAGSNERFDFRPTKQELDEVTRLFNNDFRIPNNFCQTAPPEQKPFAKRRDPPSLYYRNPQSTVFCEKLGIKDLNFMMCQSIPPGSLGVPYCCEHEGVASSNNPDEIDVGGDDDQFGDDDFVIDAIPTSKNAKTTDK